MYTNNNLLVLNRISALLIMDYFMFSIEVYIINYYNFVIRVYEYEMNY